MKTKDIVKLNFLILGLGITIFAIYSLNSKGLSPTVKSLLGLPVSNSQPGQSFTLKWCDTRVSGIVIPDRFKIKQDGRKWLAESTDQKEVDFLAMEKWLANHCAVKAEYSLAAASNDFLPALIIKFVDGRVEILKKNAEGIFQWRDRHFKSQQFEQAIASLIELPAKD